KTVHMKLFSRLCTCLPVGFMFIALNTKSQVIPDPLSTYNKHLAERWSGEYMQVSQYKVKGSPYLLGKAFPGTVKFADGNTINNVQITYDLYNEKVSFEKDSLFFELDKLIKEFSIMLPAEYGNTNLVFRNAASFGDTKKKGYYNIISESGKYVFMKEFKLKLVPDPANTLAKDYKMFEQYYEYLLYDTSGRNLSKIKLNKKSVLSFFQNKSAAEKEINDSRIDVSTEAGVSLLLTRIGSL
ncbi:MAG TPA: hypothetical protein VF144_14550, partial [Chitinophagaceae bacterium]